MKAPLAVAVMAKAPVAGLAKTRLAPALGPEGAARLAARFLQHTLAQALEADLGPVHLFAAPTARHPALADLDPRVQRHDQVDGDLGRRMDAVFQTLQPVAQAVLLMGTDAPALTAAVLQGAAHALRSHDAVAVPTRDGGYVLIGLRRPAPGLFDGMPWSTPEVMALTRRRAFDLGLSLAELPALVDVDEPADLAQVPPDWLAT